MDKKQLNTLRRMAGVDQDFSADPRPITEDRIPGISQILRGDKGDQLFYLICEADKEADLADVMTEVDFPALANIIKKANNTVDWQLFPHSQQNEALNLARKRLAMVTEAVGVGANSRAMDNAPAFGSEEDIAALELEEEPTNICPDCEGGEHPPAIGKCERCDGLGEVFEAKKEKPDFADLDNDGDKKESAKKAAKDAKEEQEEKPDFADIDKDGDKKESAKKAAKEVKEGKTPIKKEHQEKYKKISRERQLKYLMDLGYSKGEIESWTGTKTTKSIGWEKSTDRKPKKVKENYHTSDNYPLTHVDSNQPHNVDASYDTIWDKPEEIKDDHLSANDTTTIKVPSKILSELKRVIGETKAEAEKAKPRDFERSYYYEDTAEALQIVYDYLSQKTVEGLKEAQIYIHRMANVSRLLIPDAVWKFIISGGTPRSLKSYVNDVKEPVTGKPFGIVPITILNKNTHTE